MYFFWISIKVVTAIKQLLYKPYLNEVILRGQNLPLKCCQPLKLLTYFEKVVRSFHKGNMKCVGQRAAKLLSLNPRKGRGGPWGPPCRYWCAISKWAGIMSFPLVTFIFKTFQKFRATQICNLSLQFWEICS